MRMIHRDSRVHATASSFFRLAFVIIVMSTGCGKVAEIGEATPESSQTAGGTVVLYSALDQEFAEPVLRDLGKQAGIQVLSKFDVESTKTADLPRR